MSTIQERMNEVFPEPRARGLQAAIKGACHVSGATVSAWFNIPEKVSTMSRAHAEAICAKFDLDISPAWLAEGTPPKLAATKGPSEPPAAPLAQDMALAASTSDDVVITQYVDVGGGMNTNGRLVLEGEPAGEIKSWRVDREWLRLHVPVYTSLQNLCIVTGFGPSMRPMFNPGDPLLMDRGVNRVDHEGIFFFRVGDEGYIKIIQRVPEFDGPGFVLRVISKNKEDFPPYDLSPNNPHLHIIGKILTVWKSEQY